MKKISVLALAGLLSLPALAAAGGGEGPSVTDLERKVEALTRELDELKGLVGELKAKKPDAGPGQEIQALKGQMADLKNDTESALASLDERAEEWDLSSRFSLYGDFRARLDYVNAKSPAHFGAFDVANFFAGNIPGAIAPPLTPAGEFNNDTLMTNRFRLNMRVKAMENLDFKGRLAMYKIWGMQSNQVNPTGNGPFLLSSLAFDGSSTRQPQDSILRVDRAYVNWNNIGDHPIWFSIGRRPTSDGPPGQLRQGIDERMATPTAYMDYPFDGLTLGYAYFNPFPGRIRFCYGRGFEAGPFKDGGGLNDVDFAGISWDVYDKDNRFLTVQSFGAFNMFNVPGDVTFPNPNELAGLVPGNGIIDRTNLGNIYHTTGTYLAKVNDLNYFLALGWSRTDPSGYDEVNNSLLTSPTATGGRAPLEDKNGYSVYAGVRYDMPAKPFKLGLEYNYGSEDWIAFTPGHDDIYASKLAVRGHAAEAYAIWDIPAGEAISKYASAFMRLGYMHQWYDFTGSGNWYGAPTDIDNLAFPQNAQFFAPMEDLDQVYLSMDVYF